VQKQKPDASGQLPYRNFGHAVVKVRRRALRGARDAS
jgi:hypothetical protein